MSGIYLLGLIAIWSLIGWLIYRFWHNATVIRDLNKIAYYALGGVLFIVWFASGFWPFAGKKIYYDTQVMEMCAKDGGVKVYETVELPAEKYDSYAKKNWHLPDESNLKPSDEYYYSRERIIYREKDPRVSRRETQLIRHSDKKVLGTYIDYGRGGGDLPGFWHGSHFTCPDPKEVQFENAIFLKKGSKL
ncbi:MAG: hypothetical protein KZQ91_11360 [Candidatus Thiodiazotropha sp. (ex Lucinoma borealis)]|nr:hypothetical protein [Candidatus Thiodiazotropha sp. (ex Lucinoma borealis)]